MAAAENRTCIITLRLSDLRSQASLRLFLRHQELTNEPIENEDIHLKVTQNL